LKKALEYLESFAVLALILAGLTGFAYHLFREGGWIESVTGSFWSFTMRSPLIVLVTIAGATVIALIWRRDRKTEQAHGKAATMVFYSMVAAGVYFLGRLAIVGTL